MGAVQETVQPGRDVQTGIAYQAAGVAFGLAPGRGDWADEVETDDWPFIGCALVEDPDWSLEQAVDAEFERRRRACAGLADFVRAWPEAGAEPLFRHARSLGIHAAASDGWLAIPAPFRLAYTIFRETLIAADAAAAKERERAAARALAGRPEAPVLVRESETIFEREGTILEKVGDPERMINLGGPAVEEEASDAAGHLEEPAAGAADQDHLDPAAAAAGGGDAGAAAAGLSGDDAHAGDAAPAEGEGEAGAASPPDDAGAAEGVAGGAAEPDQPDGMDGAAAADAPAGAADALQAQARALSPAREADRPAPKGTRRKL